ncbi:hypothetical protein NEUTE1DRAFT_43348 [Neurospora tetrasperma FGSC 2508]|uniref:DUF7924 domain-containing protein n=1 Tax=Neurospora tetrasperma (strain FGSC 2508 / ATCC MYA-4615 / P0657) TaxID=510951 RepID=F8MLP7_NEUT8|nr:uncharacterized protein NEUTE1DRAFT_43348 [Neurospora tetrasperma FGSC 2508]EGO58466.1 hypothetical protein NEUTE1DRAFT_43348 [Neurospora tetrasperma FGSC 2508]EGZ71200.1 hypothetical protein NEUTE2DRAFT_166281 [Neurospora tetrasperma FGSC 2509]
MPRLRSKRPREGDPSPPPRVYRATRATRGHKPGQSHTQVQISPSPSPPGPPRIPRAKRARTGPSPSLLQDKHPVDRLSIKEEEHGHIAAAHQLDLEPKTDHPQTIPPAPRGTDTRLTRENLAKLNRMSSNLASHDTFRSSGRGSGLTNPTSVASTGSHRSSSAYTNGFPSILEDSGIHIHGDPSMLADLQELRRERSVRPSLAPFEFPDSRIERLIRVNSRAVSEADVERNVVTAIIGFGGHLDIPNSSNIAWSNLRSMTGKRTVDPRPDLFYGARTTDIAREIRDEIGHLIQPSILLNAPAAPHFVMEVKGPSGRLDILKRQAAYSGAAAARAVFTLENFGVDDPKYDDTAKAHAWTFSAYGDLTQYAVRVGRPTPGSPEPSYHLTHIKTHHIMESVDQFRRGVSAFRHCRDESHAKNEARLAEAHERLRRRSQQTTQQTSHPVPGSTLPPGPLPESHPGPPELSPSVENDTPLQQDCEARSPEEEEEEEEEAAPGPGSPSTTTTAAAAAAVMTTSMPPASAPPNVTKATPRNGAPSKKKKKKMSMSNRPSSPRPQRTRRRPKRFGTLDDS